MPVITVTPSNSLTILAKLPGSVTVFSGTTLQNCCSKGHVLKQSCLFKRNPMVNACQSESATRLCLHSQRRNISKFYGLNKPRSSLNASSFASWNSSELISDLQRFLKEIGTDPKEARFWLKQFLNVDQQRPFAVVEVDSEIFTEQRQRNSLQPVLVYGSMPGDNHKSFQEMNAVSVAASCVLCESLESQGVQARVLYAGSNTIQVENQRVTNISPKLIQWCMVQQAIPIIPAFGETSTGQIVPLHSWEVTSAVTIKLQPLKVIKVNCKGGFKDEQEHVIANINLPFDAQSVKGKSWCTPSVLETIAEVSDLLENVPENTSVVITAADKVLQELFTHRGSGTFLKITEPVHKYHSLEGIDLEKLTTLFTKSFRRTLSPTYFQDIRDRIHTVYLSEKHTGAAVILSLPGCDVPYLCKFAVSAQAQGEGTGVVLWDAIQTDFRQLFWRSRGSNPINQWYFKKSEGSWSNGRWTVFWYGITDPALSPVLIKKAVSMPETFPMPAIGEKEKIL